MKATDMKKYQGIFPAFYACYDDAGEVSPARVRALTEYLIGKKVNGLYVGGSSGECIYQSVAERKAVLEAVIAQAAGRITVIAHVACNNTRDSMALAAHAESVGRGLHRRHPADILPPARPRRRPVLERHRLRRAEYGFHHL